MVDIHIRVHVSCCARVVVPVLNSETTDVGHATCMAQCTKMTRTFEVFLAQEKQAISSVCTHCSSSFNVNVHAGMIWYNVRSEVQQ